MRGDACHRLLAERPACRACALLFVGNGPVLPVLAAAKTHPPALVGGGDSGAGAAGTHQAGGGLAALFPLPADGRQLHEFSGGAVAAGHLRRAAAKAAAGGARLLSSLFPGGQLRAHRPLPAVSLRPGPSARPRTLPHPASPGHLEAGWRLRERRGNQRLYPAVLACRPAGKRLWSHPLLYVRLHLLPLL